MNNKKRLVLDVYLICIKFHFGVPNLKRKDNRNLTSRSFKIVTRLRFKVKHDKNKLSQRV